MIYSNNAKFIYDTETFVKESIDSFATEDLVLAITHDVGQIQVLFNKQKLQISGTVYTFLNNGNEQCYQILPKDLTYDQSSFLVLSSAIYAFLSEAYKIADMFKQSTFQSTDYAK
jgi:hypothetical protein